MMHSKNKVFFVAVNTGFSKGEVVDDCLIDFYTERSGNGLYCSIVGNVLIPNGHGTNDNCSIISASKSWKSLSQSIYSKGAVPGIQLSTVWHEYQGIKKFRANLDEQVRHYKHIMGSLSRTQVSDLLDGFERACDLAIVAGFKHVQIHAAHGYMLSLLTDRFFSQYVEYVFYRLQKIAAILKSYSVESSIRISMSSGNELVDALKSSYLGEVVGLGFNYIDLSDGYYNFDKRLIYPSTDRFIERRKELSMSAIEAFPEVSFIISGKANSMINENLKENISIGLCRDLIANPNFLIEPSHGCENLMNCHYFSKNQKKMSCGKWKRN